MLSLLMRHRYADKAFGLAGCMCAVAGTGFLVFVIAVAATKGASRLSPEFFVQASKAGGTAGGILYQIFGSCLLLVSAAVIVTPFACGIAVTERVTSSKLLKQLIRPALHLLNSTPSILFGILGFLFFVKMCAWDKSWLGGGFILALMILPTVTLSLRNRMETIPAGYVETARSLGLSDDQLIRSILLPYGYGGLLTGLVMGLARAAGETAPVMFTAVVFSGATVPDGILDNPVLALPYHIFNLAQDVLGEGAVAGAWATALVLIIMVLIMSLFIAPWRSRSHEEARGG